MSDTDSTYESEWDGSDYSDESSECETMQQTLDALERLSASMKAMLAETEELEARLYALQRPIEDLALEQLGDAPFLKASPFRNSEFVLKIDGIPGFRSGQRYAYHEIVGILRAHLLATDALDATGVATLAKPLQRMLGVQEERMSFLSMLGHLRKVFV